MGGASLFGNIARSREATAVLATRKKDELLTIVVRLYARERQRNLPWVTGRGAQDYANARGRLSSDEVGHWRNQPRIGERA